MTELQARVWNAAQSEPTSFAAKHLERKVGKMPFVIGRALVALWKQGKLYRLKTQARDGWYYSRRHLKGFESYREHDVRIKIMAGVIRPRKAV